MAAATCDPRPVGPGLERTRLEFVVGEDGDAQATSLDPQRSVGLLEVAAATEGGDPLARQEVEGLDEGLAPVVAGMVVGDGERVEASREQRQDSRVGAEGGDLVRQRRAGGGDRTLEVADAVVGIPKQRGEGCQRIGTGGDQASGSVVEHDVADEQQAQRLGGDGPAERAAERDEQAAQAAPTAGVAHGARPATADNSHQYCNSPSRTGS